MKCRRALKILKFAIYIEIVMNYVETFINNQIVLINFFLLSILGYGFYVIFNRLIHLILP